MVMNFKEFTDPIKKDLRNDYDVTIAVTGDKGVGKSTFCYHAAKNLDDKFKIERNFIFEPFYKPIKDRIFKRQDK